MMKWLLYGMITVVFTLGAAAVTPEVNVKVNWSEHLEKQDRHFTVLPSGWKDAPLFGNAMLGSVLYVNPESANKNELRLHVSRADVHGHLPTYEYGWTAYSRPRFEIGDFDLQLKGTIQSIDWHQDLWNAELRGTVTTDKGTVSIRHFVHAQDMAIVTDISGQGGEAGCVWKWTPGVAVTGRNKAPATPALKTAFIEKYGKIYRDVKMPPSNPAPVIKQQGGITTSTQNLFGGGQFSAAWKEIKHGESRRLIVSIANSYPEATATQEAFSNVQNYAALDQQKWERRHQAWWHAYYPQSFVSVPDAEIEKYYWNMIYLMGCNSRSGRVFASTQGLWFFRKRNGWPYVTNDYNTQAVLWPVYTANRLGLGDALIEYLNKHQQTLIDNVRPVEWQKDCAFLHITTALDLIGEQDSDARYTTLYGCLPWVMHNCWMQYRYSMDEAILRDTVFPLLRRSMNLYGKVLEDQGGVLHLPEGYSPETGIYKDCTFELSLIHWSCTTLLKSCEILNINDPLIPWWKDVLERLVDYPVSAENGYANGIRNGKVSGPIKHRHGSHLMMIFPLRLVTIEDEDQVELLETSVEFYRHEKRLPAMVTAHAGPMCAGLGKGDWALKELRDLIGDLHPSGLWHHTICLETPFGGVTTLQDMALQSWGETIRVFPAVSEEWADFAFHDFRAEGAFLVSASRKGGETQFVRIKSLAGEPCRIRPGLTGKVKVSGTRDFSLKELEEGLFELDLKKGEEAIIWSGATPPTGVITPVIQ